MQNLPQTFYSKRIPSLYLLLALLLFLIVPIPITFFPESSRLIFAAIYSILIIAGLATLTFQRRHFLIGLVLGIISFGLIWITLYHVAEPAVEIWKSLALFLFFSYLAFFLFRGLAFQKKVNLDIIFNSISGYLIIGIIGGTLFQLLELSVPESFNLAPQSNGLFDLHYLSFVTLTTLGFGDITPTSEAAKSLTLIISLAGQLYLTILIAMLVGKYLSK